MPGIVTEKYRQGYYDLRNVHLCLPLRQELTAGSGVDGMTALISDALKSASRSDLLFLHCDISFYYQEKHDVITPNKKGGINAIR